MSTPPADKSTWSGDEGTVPSMPIKKLPVPPSQEPTSPPSSQDPNDSGRPRVVVLGDSLSAGYGLLYLMLYHDIKSNQFGVIYKRLPDLETLERMSFAATFVGTALLTVSITLGVIWLPLAIESFSYADPKLFSAIAVWVVYVFCLVAKQVAGWKGRRMMVATLTGFILAVISIAVTTILPYGFHKFGR